MADDEKVKSTDKLLQALDALTQLNQARRSYSLPLTRSGSSSKASSDAGADDTAVVEEARPRARASPRLSPTSPIWSKPNNMVNEEEEGDDSAMIIIIKPRHRLSLMLPFGARSKLIKEHDDDFDDYDDDDDDDYSDEGDHDAALLETLEAYGETKGITYHGPIRVTSRLGLRRMSCLFSVEVMAAQGLPAAMNGLRLVVAMRKKETRDGAVRTMPARVRLGAADFDEVLCVRCSLYGATGRPASFEPRPFVLSLVAIDAPEMDLGRGAVDLGLFAKEFVEKRGRQWDMAFPLAGKAKGGELVVKLAFQSIDHDGSAEWYTQPAGEDSASLSSLRRSSVSTGRRRRVVPRKLKRSSVSSVVTNPKMTPMETGVPTPELSSSDSFKVDEPETELTRIEEVKETQRKELECEPTDESTPVTDVDEEALQTESEQEPTDEPTPVAQVEEERQKESEQRSSDQLTPPIEVNKEEQQKEPECQTSNEPTTIAEVNGEGQIEPEQEPSDEPTPLMEVEGEQEKQEEPELRSADDPTPVTDMKEEEQQEELVSQQVDEPTPITEVKEEHREPEREAENNQEDDYSKLPEFKANSLIASDEVAKVMANRLEEKSEVTLSSDLSDVVANVVEPVNGEAARSKEVTGESMKVMEPIKDRGAAKKPVQRRFKWRTIALLVPLAILNSRTLGARR